MAAITQVGTALTIGFDSYTFTGTLMSSMNIEGTGEQKVVKDQDNATHTVLVEDLGFRLSFDAVILSGQVAAKSIDIGDSITVNAVIYRVESVSWAYQAEEAKLSVTCIKEASMTYS